MRVTNKTGLPDGIFRAVQSDTYDSGRPAGVAPEDYFTPTKLIAPTQQAVLKERHADEIEEDAADRIWSLLGQSVHGILERASSTRYERLIRMGRELDKMTLPTQLEGTRSDAMAALRAMAHACKPEAEAHHVVVEKRYYNRLLVSGRLVTIGGALDHLDIRDGILSDYKVTSVYSAKEGAKVEWVIQNSINAWLCRGNSKRVGKAQNVVIYRDWSVAEALRNPEYPQQQVQVIETPIWPDAKIEVWMADRIKSLRAARAQSDDELPECSADERWNRDSAWVVRKQGNKMAVPKSRRSTREEAEEFAEALRRTKPGVFEVEFRPGQSKRCEMYCAARDFCSQWQDIASTMRADAGDE